MFRILEHLLYILTSGILFYVHVLTSVTHFSLLSLVYVYFPATFSVPSHVPADADALVNVPEASTQH